MAFTSSVISFIITVTLVISKTPTCEEVRGLDCKQQCIWSLELSCDENDERYCGCITGFMMTCDILLTLGYECEVLCPMAVKDNLVCPGIGCPCMHSEEDLLCYYAVKNEPDISEDRDGVKLAQYCSDICGAFPDDHVCPASRCECLTHDSAEIFCSAVSLSEPPHASEEFHQWCSYACNVASTFKDDVICPNSDCGCLRGTHDEVIEETHQVSNAEQCIRLKSCQMRTVDGQVVSNPIDSQAPWITYCRSPETRGECHSLNTQVVSDEFCSQCHGNPGETYCPPQLCECSYTYYVKNNEIRVSSQEKQCFWVEVCGIDGDETLIQNEFAAIKKEVFDKSAHAVVPWSKICSVRRDDEQQSILFDIGTHQEEGYENRHLFVI